MSVGSQKDPKSKQGLAHLLEHMVFLDEREDSSPGLADESNFKEWIEKNGGYCNAFTSLEDTNFSFQVQSKNYSDGLARFTKMFFGRIFKPEVIEREARIVESEFRKNYSNDARKSAQILRSLANPDSSYNKFSTGNFRTYFPESFSHRDSPTESLDQSVTMQLEKENVILQSYLQAFFDAYYVPKHMSLVLYDQRSLEEIQETVISVLNQAMSLPSALANKIISGINITEDIGTDKHPYSGNFCGRVINIVPLKESNTLEIKFYFPGDPSYRKKKLLGYFSHLLGHESEGSLHSLLAGHKLALGLTTSTYVLDEQFSSLKISINLTDLGLASIR